MKTILPASALLACLLAAPSWGKTYEFKDWAIACDNTRRCAASGTQSADGENPVGLLLTREAGPGARAVGRLTVVDPDDGKVGRLKLQAGSLSLSGLAPDQSFDAGQLDRLLPALLNADAAVLDDGQHQWTLSLAGLKAALLKMDELQGRLGTPGALAKKGSRPESSVPPAPTAPLLKPLPPPPAKAGDKALLPAILKQLRNSEQECWDGLPDAENPDAGLYRLNASQLLVLRECGRGAYQGDYKAWIASDQPPYHPRRLRLADENGKDAWLMNAGFDQGVLSSYAKGRGIGDCGSASSWAWTGQGFALMSAVVAPQCRGIPGGSALRTWTTRQK